MALFSADEVRKKAQEENGELGIENIDEKRAQNDRAGGKTGPLCREGELLIVAPHIPRQIQKIRSTRVFQNLKGERAHVHQCGKPQNTGGQMRDDAQCAPDCGGHAAPPAGADARGDGEDHARAGNQDHQERGSKKFSGNHGRLRIREWNAGEVSSDDGPVLISIRIFSVRDIKDNNQNSFIFNFVE